MSYPGHPHYIFKVCLIGAGGVGKTCIARRLCFNTFDAETKMTIVKDEQGQAIGLIVFSTDITEREQIEHELKQHRHQLQCS